MENGSRPIWFKRKKYGWGWYPATKQGWMFMIAWIILFVLGVVIYERHMIEAASSFATLLYLLYVASLIYLLLKVSYRYGEAPRWQWGDEEK